NISIAGNDGFVRVGGLQARVNISATDAALDELTVNALAGADTVDASGLLAGVIDLILNGGDDADTLIGSQGDDFVSGGRGNDTAALGAGKDSVGWDPGGGGGAV